MKSGDLSFDAACSRDELRRIRRGHVVLRGTCAAEGDVKTVADKVHGLDAGRDNDEPCVSADEDGRAVVDFRGERDCHCGRRRRGGRRGVIGERGGAESNGNDPETGGPCVLHLVLSGAGERADVDAPCGPVC